MLFIDAIVVKVRDGQVTNRPFYVVIGVTCAGERDILGIWAGDGGEGAKYWLAVLTEIKNRGVQDVCIVVCDGLKALPESITTTWELAQVQTCVVHPIRNTFRYAARQDWDQMAKDLRPVYTAVNAEQAQAKMDDFAERWGSKYPAAVKLWRSAWGEFIPFLDYEVEIRKVICTTNAIESLNARYRRAVRARGHFPNEAAALKCLYLVTRSLDPTGRGRARWVIRWKAALNAFAITFDGRINPSINQDARWHLHRRSDSPAGEASFAFYLLHVPLIGVLRIDGPNTWTGWVVTTGLLYLVILLVAVGAHVVIEVPAQRWLRRTLHQRGGGLRRHRPGSSGPSFLRTRCWSSLSANWARSPTRMPPGQGVRASSRNVS